MKILYNSVDGKLFYAVLDSEAFLFTHTTNIPLSVLEIDEIPENAELCREIKAQIALTDLDDQGRWYVESGELYEHENWVPEVLA